MKTAIIPDHIDIENPTKGAHLPMVLDSWRYGFTQTDEGLEFGNRDNGQFVAYEAAAKRIGVLQEMVDSMSAVLKYVGDCAGVKEGDVAGLMAWADECCCTKIKQENTNLRQQIKDQADASELAVMLPHLTNKADMVDGHYCISRKTTAGYYEFWDEKIKKWCSAGTVFELGRTT